VLERARKAEAEAATLKTQLKTETTTSKKTVQEMKTALSESSALSQKSEREYLTLRDSIKGLVESWKIDTERLREEMRLREEKWKAEAESASKKYNELLEEVKSAEVTRTELKVLQEEDKKVAKKVERAWQDDISKLKEEVDRSSKESDDTKNIAKCVPFL
jgi:hypothetical protein